MVGTTLKSDVKAGSRKGRLNYDAGFKQQLAKASCEPGVSIARLALEHGLNANMVHKWRRLYLAAMAATAPLVSTEFLPVTIASPETAMTELPDRVRSPRPAKPPVLKQATPSAGVIEIKFGGATVRIDGRADVSTLAAILSHFHP
jgi:transposase